MATGLMDMIMKSLKNRPLATIVIAASAAMMASAHAQTVPPFEVGDGLEFRPQTQLVDLGLQFGYLTPRAPALMHSTQQAARVGLPSMRHRGMDLRDTLGRTALDDEGGVWFRLSGGFGDRTLRLQDLTIRDPAGDIGFDDVLEGVEEAIEDAFSDLLDDPDIDPDDLQDIVDTAVNGLFDLSHDHRHYGFNVGFDLIQGAVDNRAWLVGAMVGYVRSTVEFDDFKAWDAGSKFDGDAVNVGIYGGMVAGDLYVDVALGYAWHKLDMALPLMQLQPGDAVLSTDGRSLSGHIDAGWRFPLANEQLYIEPVAGLSWVRTDIDDTNVQPSDALTHGRDGSVLIFGRQESLRGNLGARVGGEWAVGQLTLTGDFGLRSWREFERGAEASLGLRGDLRDLDDPDSDDVPMMLILPPVEDRFANSFTDISLSGGLRTADGRLAAGLNLSRLAASGYKSHGVTANVRYQW